MNKKVIGIAVVVVLLVVAGGITFGILHNKQSASTETKSATAPACLASSDNPDLKISSEDQTYIPNAVVTGRKDVPAGTNVTVYVKTYDGTTAAGSALYPGNYGSYNFTIEKGETINSYQGGWSVTSFVACKA